MVARDGAAADDRPQARLGGAEIAGALQRTGGRDAGLDAQQRLVVRRLDRRQRGERAAVVTDERARLTEAQGGAQAHAPAPSRSASSSIARAARSAPRSTSRSPASDAASAASGAASATRWRARSTAASAAP